MILVHKELEVVLVTKVLQVMLDYREREVSKDHKYTISIILVTMVMVTMATGS